MWEVLTQYPGFLARSVQPLGTHGGFSGALLARIEGEAGAWCLKGFPPASQDLTNLQSIHRLMGQARQSGLLFIPDLARSTTGDTAVSHGGRLWELSTWMPGRADFREDPRVGRLEAACRALARLHQAWRPVQRVQNLCPGIQRRLEKTRSWCSLLKAGWNPNFATCEPEIAELSRRLWHEIFLQVDSLPGKLAPYSHPLPVQPCLCDVWHDHVLFQGDEVTGLVDFGSVKKDHVAVDLARLLGSLAEEDENLWEAGLRAYREIMPLTPEEGELARALDKTGTVVAAVTWLRWLFLENRSFADLAAVRRRLETLARRLEVQAGK